MAFLALVELVIRDLIRRRAVWIIVLACVGMVALNFWVLSEFQELLREGESYAIATRESAGHVARFADAIATGLVFAAILIAPLVAPESRRNGTTQFALTFGVGRLELALAQYVGLAVLTAVVVIVVHGGVAIVGLRFGAIAPSEAALGWIGLLAGLLLLEAAVFAISLTLGVFSTLLIVAGVPMVVAALTGVLMGIEREVPMWLVRMTENAGLLVPSAYELIFWPRLTVDLGGAYTPEPAWTMLLLHATCTTAFWVVGGLWLYMHHDFGSRTALQ